MVRDAANLQRSRRSFVGGEDAPSSVENGNYGCWEGSERPRSRERIGVPLGRFSIRYPFLFAPVDGRPRGGSFVLGTRFSSTSPTLAYLPGRGIRPTRGASVSSVLSGAPSPAGTEALTRDERRSGALLFSGLPFPIRRAVKIVWRIMNSSTLVLSGTGAGRSLGAPVVL